MKWVISTAVTALLGSSVSYAADFEACVQHRQLVGSCWSTHGRVSLHNGNPSVRIWPVNSKRVLGVREADPQLFPPDLAARLTWETNVFADLKVCPLTKQRAGLMQIVCVASAENLVVRSR
jgi:hypothetical protein